MRSKLAQNSRERQKEFLRNQFSGYNFVETKMYALEK